MDMVKIAQVVIFSPSVLADNQIDLSKVGLACGLLVFLGLAVVGFVHKVRTHAIAVPSRGLWLLIVGTPLVVLGVAGYVLQDEVKPGSFLDGVTWVTLFASLLGITLVFVGLGVVLVESVIESVREKHK